MRNASILSERPSEAPLQMPTPRVRQVAGSPNPWAQTSAGPRQMAGVCWNRPPSLHLSWCQHCPPLPPWNTWGRSREGAPSIGVHPAPYEGGGCWEVAIPAGANCTPSQGSRSGRLGQRASGSVPPLSEGAPAEGSPRPTPSTFPDLGPLLDCGRRRETGRGEAGAPAGICLPSRVLRGRTGLHSPRTRPPRPAAGARAGAAASRPAERPGWSGRGRPGAVPPRPRPPTAVRGRRAGASPSLPAPHR